MEALACSAWSDAMEGPPRLLVAGVVADRILRAQVVAHLGESLVEAAGAGETMCLRPATTGRRGKWCLGDGVAVVESPADSAIGWVIHKAVADAVVRT